MTNAGVGGLPPLPRGEPASRHAALPSSPARTPTAAGHSRSSVWVSRIPSSTTASLRLLTALADGERTMRQLSESLDVTPRRITALVDALEEHALVERRAHPTDGRSTLVTITPAGLEQQRQGCQHTRTKLRSPSPT
ncbi:MarR family winged helix-turn-helix transcriptional regulator [Streptomyces alfalfae]